MGISWPLFLGAAGAGAISAKVRGQIRLGPGDRLLDVLPALRRVVSRSPLAFLLGLDFALPGMFIGLLVIQILSQKKYFVDIIVALSAVLIVVVVSFYFTGSAGVMIATILASTIGMVIERWR